MTDQISFPPLLDLSPGELQAHKEHLVSEIAQQPERRRLSLPVVPPLRLRFALPAVAAVFAAVAAVIFTGTLGDASKNATGTRGGTPTQTGTLGTPPVVRGMQVPSFGLSGPDYKFSGGTLSSIALTVRTDNFADATMQLRVLHSDSSSVADARSDSAQVVFHEQAAMTSTGATAPDAAHATWSGTLSTSDWQGGCQAGLYQIQTAVYQAGSAIADPFTTTSSIPTERSVTEWFSCDGRTGISDPGTGIGALLGPAGNYSNADLPTLAHPLADGQPTTLADASNAWGSQVVLPNTALVQPSDVGTVWMRNVGSKTVAVAVTFPSQGLMVLYLRPWPFPVFRNNPQGVYQQLVKQASGSDIADLNGTPAFVVPKNSGPTGQSPGLVFFQLNGGDAVVMGNADSTALEAAAQSILDQSGS
jgi:hypothetical protein